jgi:hypothetical protein
MGSTSQKGHPEIEISLQPKQEILAQLVENSMASWLGAGGGRGGAKSGGMDRIILDRRLALPGTIGAIVMRNYEQVKKYHIDQMQRDFPILEKWYHATDHKLVIPMPSGPPSEIHFRHAETLADVERIFRSGNYYDVAVDQAEQFSQAELREMKQAVRWKGTLPGSCKFILGFNMGGAGIGFLDNIFHLGKFGPNERASDFAFVHFFPWDNVEWVRGALEQDGLTEADYYHVFTEEQRQWYCANKSDYGRNLVSQDTPLRNRDWLGSWEALEGAYFGRVFSRESTVITPEQVATLIKPWWKKWISQDWGKGHYCATQWHARGEVAPDEANRVLGWEVSKAIKLTITCREYMAGGAAEKDEGGERELSEQDIARQIVARSPADERDAIRAFFLSPDAFEMSVRRANQSKISELMGQVLKAGGLPYPTKAGNARIDGWVLMFNVLLETMRHGQNGEDCWLISENCPELIRAIPLLMRDPKNLDDVLKTDKTEADITMDAADCGRYGLKSMLSPGKKPKPQAIHDAIMAAMYRGQAQPAPTTAVPGALISRYSGPPPASAVTPEPNFTAAHMANLRASATIKKQSEPIRRINWRRRGGRD